VVCPRSSVQHGIGDPAFHCGHVPSSYILSVRHESKSPCLVHLLRSCCRIFP
jgi:hypothetical protein